MFDSRITDNLLNKFFANITPHLRKLSDDAVDGQNQVARDYIKTNDPVHRKTYFNLESRSSTVRKICQAFLEDPATTDENKQQIYKIFPDLLPKISPPEPQTSPKAPVVTITKTGDAPKAVDAIKPQAAV